MMDIPRAKNIKKIRKKKKFFICAIYGLILLTIIGANLFAGDCNFDINISRLGDIANFGKVGKTPLSSVIGRDKEGALLIEGVLELSLLINPAGICICAFM
jgi:hypothetical protein